jgi:two-component system phosphate regulon sensor histidine kinase PhoR
MTSFRTKLFVTLMSLLLLVLVVLGLMLGQLFKSYYLEVIGERFDKESVLVASYFEEIGGIHQIEKDKLDGISDLLNVRIAIVDKEGRIVHDSKGDIDHGSDKEYLAILKEIANIDQTYGNEAKTLTGSDLYYYWEPIVYNGKQEGFAIFSTQLKEIEHAFQQIWWILTISFALALVAIVLLGYKIMSRYTKPIEMATDVAMELAKGNYRARVYESKIDETGMLNVAINILARNLQSMVKTHEMQNDRLTTLIENVGSALILIDSRGYINLINRTYKEIFDVKSSDNHYKLYYEVIEYPEICKIIEEIFMTEQKIKRQLILPIKIERRHFEVYGVPIIGTNDVWKGILLVFHDITEIKKLEQMRKDFVSNVSHELKTPITSIKGFSETLLDGAMEDQETLEAFLNIILKESDRLQSLIYDLLELSKIENEGFRLSIQLFNLIDLLDEVNTLMMGKAEEKEIDLRFIHHTDQVILEGDVYRLKQVFINIISNSLIYTSNGGSVAIRVEEASNKVKVHITDTGMGIEKEEIPRIFERFYRVNKARDRISGGTGLGLAIVKHILEVHKGKVTVESEVGTGTTFTIELMKKFLHG